MWFYAEEFSSPSFWNKYTLSLKSSLHSRSQGKKAEHMASSCDLGTILQKLRKELEASLGYRALGQPGLQNESN